MKTLTNFCNIAGHINPKLIRAVVRQCGHWEEFQAMAQDVRDHGADAGFGGFIYYADTVPFFTRNRDLVLELARTVSNDIGEGLMEMIQRFGCIGTDYSLDEIGQTLYGAKSKVDTQLANCLAWFALEEVCRAYCDVIENA